MRQREGRETHEEALGHNWTMRSHGVWESTAVDGAEGNEEINDC